MVLKTLATGRVPDWDALRCAVGADAVGLGGSTVYDEGRTVWHPAARSREPLAVIRPTGTADVAETIRWARREGVRLSPRSGGHAFDGFPVREGTVLVDLSHMSEMNLSPDGLVRAQPGCRVLALAEALSPSGRALPLGDCGTVALGGLLAGGGFGYASRVYGLTIDSVVEATIVTGAGDMVTVGEGAHADLFWACRGGGGAAGIVTEFALRTFEVGAVTAFSLDFSWQAAREMVLAYDNILAGAPRSLDVKMKMRSTGADRYLDTSMVGPPGCIPGIPIVQMSGQYLGPRIEAETLLDPLLSHPALTAAHVNEENYFDAVTELIPLPSLNEPAPEALRPMRVASDFMRGRIGPDDADAVVRFVDEAQFSADLFGGCVLIEPADGAVHEQSISSTAFAHRSERLLMQWELVEPEVQDAQTTARLDRHLCDVRQRLASNLSGARYVNYADRLDNLKHWWGPNSAELEAIAARYDPDEVIVSRIRP
ncbi:MAG: FAD-binding oxidoreductase [Devosia sp.]